MSVRRPGMRVMLVLVALAAVLVLSACTQQEPSIAVEEQVPADVRPDPEAEEGDGDAEGDDDGGETLTFVAVDNEFTEYPETAPAGSLTFELINEGNLEHDVVIEELGDQLVVEALGGETDTGQIDMEPGDYTFYCAIPGHRATMEETLTIE